MKLSQDDLSEDTENLSIVDGLCSALGIVSVCTKLKTPSSAWEAFSCFSVLDCNGKRM